MSFCAGPRMKRFLGSEVSREEALKLISGICVLTEVLENCCKMECKGEEKMMETVSLCCLLWRDCDWSPRNLPALLTILGPLGGAGGDETTLPDHTCDQRWQNGVSEGLAHLHPRRSQASVSCIHLDTCWMLHLNFLQMKIPLSLVICIGDSTQRLSSLKV